MLSSSCLAVTASLLAAATASTHTQRVDVEALILCTDPAPTTIYQTVTITDSPAFSTAGASPPQAPSIITNGGIVTSYEYDGATTSVWVSTLTKTNTATTTPPPPLLSTLTTSYISPSSTPTIHNVQVGADGLFLYAPNQLNASVGDIVRFDFLGKNHTVTQSNFPTPCTPNGGFDTGFNQFNPGNETGLFVRDFIVNVSTPLWFYCKQKDPVSHCAKGMVLGVNPAGKFEKFLEMAEATGNASATVISGGNRTVASNSTVHSITGRTPLSWNA